jgi:hypothetical protein
MTDYTRAIIRKLTIFATVIVLDTLGWCLVLWAVRELVTR